MKLENYKHPETGEIQEFDVQGHDPIPQIWEVDGVKWERFRGKIPAIHIPIHMSAKDDNNRHRFNFSRSPSGRKSVW